MRDLTPIHAVAPLRISFVGGGTDFPHWYAEHGGAVLSTTIDHYVRVRVAPREDREITVRSLDLGQLVRYRLDEGPEYDGVMDLAKAAIDRMGVDTGVDVDIESEAPPGSGLGGSSALVTAMVAGLAMLGDRACSAEEVARLSYAVERDDLGISGGWQDQYAAAYGGCNLIEFGQGGATITPVRADPGRLEELRRRLLLCYTGGVRRNVGLIDTQIELFRAGREDTLLGMKQLQEMAYAMRDTIEHGDLDRLGPMLRDAFESKKRMNPHVVEDTPIEAMLDAAREAGASGGKICGAGGGGYLLIASEPGARAHVRAALEALGGQFAAFDFDRQGVRARRGDALWTPGPSSARP
ncbi:MAG TPA: GHMP kinase [Actinomycetota bacterium]|jgi:D-glycero-alpha-D-manno-heptose-7-phosphate kinase